MSSVSAASSYSDLDARTDFVLNRIAFLESVPDVMENENTPENKQKVAVWRDNNYIPLIVRSIMDPNEEIYDHAIWATGNLLGSDDAEVAAMARAAITDDLLKRLVQMVGRYPQSPLSPAVQNGIYYLFSNLSKSDYKMPRFFTEAIGNSLLKTMLTDKRFVVNPKAHIDFLHAVKNIAEKDPGAINVLLLTEALLNPDQSRNHSQLFHIIGTVAEHDSMICPLGIRQLMTYFTTKQLSASAGITRQEMLWVLSNIMTEPTAPACFVGEHEELKNLVESIAYNELLVHKKDGDVAVGYEALFALVNCLSGAKHMSEELKKNIAYDHELAGLIGTCLVHHNPKIVAVAGEGVDLICEIRSTFCPVEESVHESCDDCDDCDDCDECDDCDDCDQSDTEHDDTENDVQYETVCEKPVPSASDLVLGERRGKESGAVRRVVSLMVDSPIGEWVEVPSDWTLTISDLTTLQHLGYSIKDGYVGINSEIYTEY